MLATTTATHPHPHRPSSAQLISSVQLMSVFEWGPRPLAHVSKGRGDEQYEGPVNGRLHELPFS